VGQTLFVRRFQQARPQVAVHFYRRPNDLLRKRILPLLRLLALSLLL
jgi:hypothetical protein